MSYILDALRRADSERERGAVPSLHAQPEPLLPDDDPAPPRRARWTWGVGALGVVIVLGGGLVWALSRSDPAPAAPAPARAGAGPLGAAPSGAAGPAGALAGNAAALPPTSSPPVLLPPLPPEAYAPPPPPQIAAAPPRPAPRVASAPVARETREARGAAVGADAPRVYAPHELPEEIRRGIPALVVNGSVYSKNAADRFLIVNGQIVHEKDVIAPDLVLEQIKQRAAVLNSKGFRFEITY